MAPGERALRLHVESVGKPPGALVIPAGALPPRVTVVRWDRSTYDVRADVAPADLKPLLDDPRNVWVDVTGLGSRELLERLVTEFGIPWLALEDVVHSPQRPKVDAYDEARFVVVRMMDQPETLELDQFSVFVRGRVAFTFQERPGDPFDPVRARLARPESQLRQRAVDYLVYRLVDACVDSFFPGLERVADRLEALEEGAVSRAAGRLLRDLHALRRDLRMLERVALPMRDVAAALARDEEGLFHRHTRPYLRDVLDHTNQVVELIHYHGAVAGDVGELILGSLDLRMNQAMKVLAAVTFVFMPLTFVVGLYGMNFRHMPELDWPWAYPAVVVLLAVTGLGLTWWLRRRGWARLDLEE